jgi:diamine N-acetyltransferase
VARLLVPSERPMDLPQPHVHEAGPSLPLEGRRLRIRPLQRQDLDRRQQWPPFCDPLHLIWDMPPCSRGENDNWFAQMTDNRHRLAYSVDDLRSHLIGMISLREISWGGSARLGISLSSQHVGQGYGTEALGLFLPYYFITLKFRRMTLDVAAANTRAVRCYLRAGFRQVTTHWQPVDGDLEPELFDSPQYAPLRDYFRWRWDRTEALYYDMELEREDWARHRLHEDHILP